MKPRGILLFLCFACLLFVACSKHDMDNVYDPAPTPPPAPLRVQPGKLIGWWQSTTWWYPQPNGPVIFDTHQRYFGADGFLFQHENLGLGTSTGRWWWGNKDTIYISLENGYHISGKPYQPVVTRLDADSMRMDWWWPGFTGKYERFDSAMITSDSISTAYQGNAGAATFCKDDAGNSYYLDSKDYIIKKIAPDGTETSITKQSFNGGVMVDSIPAIEARLSSYHGFTVDGQGNIFIAANYCVWKISADDGFIRCIAGKQGNNIYAGDGGPAKDATFRLPGLPTIDAKNNLYIRDFMWLRMISPDGIITTIAGHDAILSDGNNGPATDANVDIVAISFDKNDNIYLSERTVLRKIAAADKKIYVVAGTGTAGYNGDNLPAGQTQLNIAGYVAVDDNGDIYYPDNLNNLVRKITASTGNVTTIAGTVLNGGGYDGDGAHATAYGLERPFAIKFDIDGNLLIYCNQRVRKLWMR